ncbi:GNAT family N-acetyltransferase [Streptomyces hydrogenans]|uniref:hypothetical protein n=1 Tax=Streptomyces hydrogenans TaxID=1873719 RepID=UPI0036EFFF90
MSDLTWRTADVRLNTKLIPDPNATHMLQSDLTDVLVALDSGFVHIDPQRGKPAYGHQSEWKIYIVPAGAVETISYRTTADDPNIRIIR